MTKEIENGLERGKKMAEGHDERDQAAIDLIRKRLESGLSSNGYEYEEDRIPRCYSVREFLSYLRGTKEYKKGLELRRRELLEKRPDIKEFLPEELQTSFECTPTFWEMIINFGQDVLHLSYRPEDYPPEFREKMEHYLDVVRKAKVGGEQANRELIEQSDRERYRAHAEVSRYFINNGFVEDMRASRYLVRLLLIDVGIEYIQDARLSISRNSVDLSFHEEVTKFSSETINEVRNRFFSSHGNVEFINKNQYSVPPLMNSTAETRDPENNRYGSGRRRQ